MTTSSTESGFLKPQVPVKCGSQLCQPLSPHITEHRCYNSYEQHKLPDIC